MKTFLFIFIDILLYLVTIIFNLRASFERLLIKLSLQYIFSLFKQIALSFNRLTRLKIYSFSRYLKVKIIFFIFLFDTIIISFFEF